MTDDREKQMKDLLEDAFNEQIAYMDELLPKLYQSHFGKFLVVAVDTREYWIFDSAQEAEEKTKALASSPDTSIGSASYIRISGPTTKRPKPN